MERKRSYEDAGSAINVMLIISLQTHPQERLQDENPDAPGNRDLIRVEMLTTDVLAGFG